jgi:hypothetical protein
MFGAGVRTASFTDAQQQQHPVAVATGAGFGGSSAGLVSSGGASIEPSILAQQQQLHDGTAAGAGAMFSSGAAATWQQQQQQFCDSQRIPANTSLCNVAVMCQQLAQENVVVESGGGLDAEDAHNKWQLQLAYLKLVGQQLQGSEVLTGAVTMVAQGQGPLQRHGIACQVAVTANNSFKLMLRFMDDELVKQLTGLL